MRRLALLAIMASATVATPASAKATVRSDEAILALVRAFSDARGRFDAKALDALLTPDYVEVSPRGEVDRRPAVLGFYAPGKATQVPPMTLGTEDVRRYGDTAIVIGSIEYTVPGPGGNAVKRTIRVTYVERRLNGRWLMAGTQYTGVQPAQAAPR